MNKNIAIITITVGFACIFLGLHNLEAQEKCRQTNPHSVCEYYLK